MQYTNIAQKKAYLKAKRKREVMRAKIIMTLAAIFVIATIIIMALPASVDASDSINQIKTDKYFTTVKINEGDSLWSIAKEFYNDPFTSRHYDSINDYISELKSMNALNNDNIHSGAYLTVTYYAPV